MKRTTTMLSLFFAGILASLIGAGCGERDVQGREEMKKPQQERQPMNQGQSGSQRPLGETPPAEQQPTEQR